MTLSEFKAWFEGFTENMEGAPTEAQFAKIKAKVAQIDGAPVTERIYVDRYWPIYRPWAPYTPVWTSTSGGAVAYGTVGMSLSNDAGFSLPQAHWLADDGKFEGFDSHAAMRDLGRAEALN